MFLLYVEKILDAMKNHSDGFNSDKVMRLALILADKLDITEERVTPKGLTIEGMRHIQFIVNFTAGKLINKKELENYYFTSII